MKKKYLYGALLLFLFASCDQKSKLQDYSIQGMRINAATSREQVTKLDFRNDSFMIYSFDGNSTNITTIKPWPATPDFKVKTNSLYLEAKVIPHPQGSVKELSLFQDKYLRMQIVDNAKKSHIIQGGWAINPGTALGRHLEGKGEWTGVIVTGPSQQSYDILPGEHKRLGGAEFYLLSAFRNVDKTPHIADDTIDLVVDYALIWSGD